MPNTQFKYEVVEFTRGVVLDINGKAFPHFLHVGENGEIPAQDPADLSEMVNEAVIDAVYCDSFERALAGIPSWWACIRAGGHLVMHLPDLKPADVIDCMRDQGNYDLIVRDDEKSILVFKKLEHPGIKNTWMVNAFSHKKTACVVRYGGFGDMLQAANIFPALKREGYRVVVMTTPKGQNILREDPNVDDWFIQDDNQVPNHELSDFWAVVSPRFDKFINLCESVEGTLIAMPGRANHMWPHAVRQAKMNDNYLEFTSALAGVEYASESKFYPTSEELEAAKSRLLPGGFNVVWALAGSACHKFYPGQDYAMMHILANHPECRIFLVGDEACKILEVGWENEERVVCLSGELGIRDTLALAKVADAVVGCETGVLNAVAFEQNRKVVLLSHSSHENLTKHWENTIALAPESLECYPCHRLHYTREFCREDAETGAAMCQRLIAPDDVYQAIVWKKDEK